MYDNLIMTGPAPTATSPLRGWLLAPVSRRAWAEVGYTLVTLPLSIVSFVFALATIANGPLWAVSATGLRKLGGKARRHARDVISEDVPAPEPLRTLVITKVSTPEPDRLAEAAKEAGAKIWIWRQAEPPVVHVRNLPAEKITELAAAADIAVTGLRPENAKLVWYTSRLSDPVAWRIRGYFGLKLPLALTGLAGVAAGWVGGLFWLTYPAWWALGCYGPFGGFGIRSLGLSFALIPLGVALLYGGAWLTHNVTEGDRWLMRGLLGPRTSQERVRALEETRARAVDDSAARLRTIERDLHDGTQAQLVALAMKLGLAMEKLADAGPVDVHRVTQLVSDAHRGVLETIEDLRTLARGIHPPVLDKGLTEALTVLAERSAVPVELITDIHERPTDAIETIAYFSAAELLTNVAKHSGARHATLEAVHVHGLLRIRVTDDGRGGARPIASGGLRGLAERIRTVDGRLEIDSPQGGPTTVTVELPSHA